MDDIFQIILWLFIIISFFSSFFKKKDPNKKQAPPQRYDHREENFPVKSQSPTSVDKEEYDILREIENMFKTDASAPTKLEEKENPFIYNRPTESEHTRKEDEYTSYETTRKAGEYTSYERGQTVLEKHRMDTTRAKGEDQLTSSEHTFGSQGMLNRKQNEIKKAKEKVDASVAKQAMEFEAFLKSREYATSMAVKIREKIKQPASFREYIIMSEILGKPAFKTGGRAYRKTI